MRHLWADEIDEARKSTKKASERKLVYLVKIDNNLELKGFTKDDKKYSFEYGTDGRISTNNLVTKEPRANVDALLRDCAMKAKGDNKKFGTCLKKVILHDVEVLKIPKQNDIKLQAIQTDGLGNKRILAVKGTKIWLRSPRGTPLGLSNLKAYRRDNKANVEELIRNAASKAKNNKQFANALNKVFDGGRWEPFEG